MQDQIELWTAVGLSFIFSIAFLIIFIKSTLTKSKQDWSTLLIIAVAMLISVALVGHTPFLSTIQNVIISLGILFALCYHVIKQETKSGIVFLLSSLMIVSLLLNQSTRTFDLGLGTLFSIKTRNLSHNENDVFSEIRRELNNIQLRVVEIEKNRPSPEDALFQLTSRIDNIEGAQESQENDENVITSIETRLSVIEERLKKN